MTILPRRFYAAIMNPIFIKKMSAYMNWKTSKL